MMYTKEEQDKRSLDRCRVPHFTDQFTFEKSDNYWRVSGPVPLHVAQQIHADPAASLIRVAGHCGCPPPEDPWITWRMPNGTTLTSAEEGATFERMAERFDWATNAMKDYTFSDGPEVKAQAKGYIETYHIDSELGLRVFVDYLRWNGLLS